MKDIVIVPTYNERENIIRMAPEIFKYLPDADVIVVDDNSPDGTAQAVEDLRKKFPRLSLLTRERKEGLGRAYVDAFSRVLNGGVAERIITMDADFSHDPRHLPELLKAAEKRDVVIGSRYVAGGGIDGWEWWRRAMSVGGNFYFRIISRLPVRDCTSGFMAIPVSLLRKTDITKTDSSGYAFLMELKYLLWRAGGKLRETPIMFRERRAGKSKISGRIVFEGILAPWKLLARNVFQPKNGAAVRWPRVFTALLLVALVVVPRFWNLTASDLVSDDALYSFRALGWLDYLGGGQTTPIQWFEKIPWWGGLSFHDAPPLVFAIQRLFFAVFGFNVLAARLPFALAGVALVWLTYALFKKFKDEKMALGAAFILAASTHASWIGRTGFLEGAEALFVLAGVFLFLRYLKNPTILNAVFFGAATGGALLSKYTAIFLPVAIVAYVIIWRRDLLAKKSFWFSGAMTLLVLTPIFLYNLAVFRTRGHFDAALSSMLGMHSADFMIIAGRGVSANFLANFKTAIGSLGALSSRPFSVLALAAFVYLCAKTIRGKSDALERFLLIAAFAALAMFSFMSPNAKFTAIIVPLLTAIVAIFVFAAARFFKEKKPTLSKLAIGVFVAVIGFEAFYSVNTNALAKPIGASPVFYAPLRSDVARNLGFNQLHEYIREKIFNPLPKLSNPRSFGELGRTEVNEETNALLFDETVNWFAYSWYLQPYIAYYRLPVVSLELYSRYLPPGLDPISAFQKSGVNGVYYVFSANDGVLDSVKKKSEMRKIEVSFAAFLEKNGYLKDEIRDNSGNVAFKVYYVKF
ncbi:MAG: glycosyltransferase [Parcubacteria group bacterium]|nr:glycosyltransferase [Parcubacteria group bacterium]